MSSIDLGKINDYYTREVFKQVVGALSELEKKSKSASKTTSVVNSTSTSSGPKFFQLSKDLDSIDVSRGWIVLNHVPILNSEVVAWNGMITSDYTIDSNLLYFNPLLEIGDTFFIKYAY